MKPFILSIFIFVVSVNSVIGQLATGFDRRLFELNLLIPTEKFNLDILDTVTRRIQNPSDIIMVRIEKSFPEYNPENEKDSFIMFIYSTDQVEYYCTAQPDAKYIGYFEYEKHMVEVCSHASLAYFFSKEEEKKQFDSISVLPHGFFCPCWCYHQQAPIFKVVGNCPLFSSQ